MNSLFQRNLFLGINNFTLTCFFFHSNSKFSLKLTEFTNANVQGFLPIEDNCTFSLCFLSKNQMDV